MTATRAVRVHDRHPRRQPPWPPPAPSAAMTATRAVRLHDRHPRRQPPW